MTIGVKKWPKAISYFNSILAKHKEVGKKSKVITILSLECVPSQLLKSKIYDI